MPHVASHHLGCVRLLLLQERPLAPDVASSAREEELGTWFLSESTCRFAVRACTILVSCCCRMNSPYTTHHKPDTLHPKPDIRHPTPDIPQPPGVSYNSYLISFFRDLVLERVHMALGRAGVYNLGQLLLEDKLLAHGRLPHRLV